MQKEGSTFDFGSVRETGNDSSEIGRNIDLGEARVELGLGHDA